MSITKSRLKQIIKEEVDRANEAFGRRYGGRYRGGDTTGYKGSYYDTPWYRQGGSGRMSDAEAREMGARGYDEPEERDYPRGPRGGMVHSTVTIYTDPEQAGERFNANLGTRLDSSADVFIVKTGYDGMVGNFVTGKNPETGFNDVGARWVLAKSPEGYTFTTGGTVGTGATPSAALRDAAMQGFEGSDVVLDQLGGGMGNPMMESRLKRDLGKDVLTRGRPVNMKKLRALARMMTKKHADNLEGLEYEITELGDIYQGEEAESPEYVGLNPAEAITLRDMLVDVLKTSPPPASEPKQAFDPKDTWIPDPEYEELNEARWHKLAGISESATRGQLKEFRFPWEDEPMYEPTPFARYLESAAATLKRNMISRAMGQDGFDEDYLRVVVGPSSDPRTGYTGRTGESYGDMIIRVYFERGDFPVVKGMNGNGVWDSKEELMAAGTAALSQAAGGGPAPTIKDATVIQIGGQDPDYGGTYGWQMTLAAPVTK